MNIRKSICIALIEVDENQTWLANKVQVHRQVISKWVSDNKVPANRLEAVAGAFGLKVSEFIAIGEGPKSVGRHAIDKCKDELKGA